MAASTLLAAAAASLMVQVLLQVPAAVATPPIGLPGCNTTCGDVQVPYPFGISPGCYWPGFNLTCDTTHRPPRLLLGGDRTVRVTDIFAENSTLRVVRTGSINITSEDGSVGVGVVLGGGGLAPAYFLNFGNELVLLGCNVHATLIQVNHNNVTVAMGGCDSTCSDAEADYWWEMSEEDRQPGNKYCTGIGCCQTAVSVSRYDGVPKGVRYTRLELNSGMVRPQDEPPVAAFVAEQGWFDRREVAGNLSRHPSMAAQPGGGLEAPLVLDFFLTHGGLPVPEHTQLECAADVARRLCKSKLSECRQMIGMGYWCSCEDGYSGNPYVPDGCQVSWPPCPRGTHGNYSMPGGCVKPSATGRSIGIGVGSGACLILLGLIAIFMIQRLKHKRAIKLKQKYFKQNRGQLLQQLVSQKTNIAERMIIPVDELARATNNFDKARKLGGGGHGTVYKGILSDLHVVAIKKSNVTVQKEIDEFINEVAILSQINHRNVVKLYGCCLETEVPLLVYEFISNGTLYHHLHIEGPISLSWTNRLRIATETASALAYLHSSISTPIIHRDIKSSNILLDDMLTAKVSDFGASRYFPIDRTGLTTRVQGTVGYMDPAYFYTGRLTERSDVYSFGVILVELLTRKKPFSYLCPNGEGIVAHFANLLAEDNLVQIIDPQVLKEGGKEVHEVCMLAASCINLRGEERPTMRQVEHTLEGLQTSKPYKKYNMVAEEFKEIKSNNLMHCPSTNKERQSNEESSRSYSLEQELVMSASYPR